MFLEQLLAYALNQLDEVPPPGYQRQTIRYIFVLRPDGTIILPPIDTSDPSTKSRGRSVLAPHMKRANAIAPKLLADTAVYALGIPADDPKKPSKPERVAAQHQAFATLVNECAVATEEPAVQAVATFLAGELPTKEELGPGFDVSATITFRVNDPNEAVGTLPVDLPSVREFWAARQVPADITAADEAMTCIICGTVGPVLERHPLKIKGIPGGQTSGVDLISANAPAFESYGLAHSQIAPTCPTCAEAYGNALNGLLSDDRTHLWTKELAYVFWTEPKKKSRFTPGPLFKRPQESSSHINLLIDGIHRADTSGLYVDPTRFYAVTLGASGARVAVKDWIDTTVGDAQKRIARYFQLQELVQWDGQPSTYVPLGWLASATVHEKATAPAIAGRSLMRLALAGTPLPVELLYQVVRRNRAEQAVSRNRAMLIKMVLGSRGTINLEERGAMTGLDPNDSHPAYLCGRLLETLNQVQYAALGKTNTTVVSRFYGTASASPQTVFPSLLRTSAAHLRRMQRDKKGAHNRLDKQVQDILWRLEGRFPRMFSAEDQGRFALGFYHQRASTRHYFEELRDKQAAPQSVSDEELEELGEDTD